ncbi:MAG: hemerythrin domain-containing protein [Acidithiobacillus sp.]|uniref:hemerythrin domain-containing protein n=1 Tax=Acidithiobacillus sp. TaxID=1872118 RepID=UPI003D0870BE
MDLLNKPAPSFDDPLGLLRACHEKMCQHALTLERLPAHLEQHGTDAEFAQASTRVLRYFEEAAPAHHRDEEVILFPWLFAQSAFPATLRDALQRLLHQHIELEQSWGDLASDLRRILAGDASVPLRLEPFLSSNRAHIVCENEEIFPVAEALLDPETARELGAAMQRRRRSEKFSSGRA